MKKIRLIIAAFILSLCMVVQSFACEEQQSDYYISQVLFGDRAFLYESNEKFEVLLSAVFLCCEQCNGIGQNKVDFLKKAGVSGIPALSDINVKQRGLMECSHSGWNTVSVEYIKLQSRRKKTLQNAVNKVFDFGFIDNLFKGSSGKCDSFSALLYYSHILSDYISNNPENTSIVYDGNRIEGYSGNRSCKLNRGKPSFTEEQKQSTKEEIIPADLDSFDRCGAVYAVIGPASMEFVGPRPTLPDPVGYRHIEYQGIVSSNGLYNRCHLVGRQFCGIDNKHNLITGTGYLNDTMSEKEKIVSDYIKETGNHVVYRVTPVYYKNNILASGVQMEAFSVEDSGKGVCFNEYCYNVQPGVDINYANGKSRVSDVTYGEQSKIIPFVTINPDNSNPDLIYEIDKHLRILFADQQNESIDYRNLFRDLDDLGREARTASAGTEDQYYVKMKEYEYRLLQVITEYVPKLLMKEKFFQSAFQ